MRHLPAALLSLLLFTLSLRAEQVVISEVMYHPQGTKPEYLEIWNISATPRDIGRWFFDKGLTFVFPDFVQGTPQAHILQAGERIVVSAADAATTRTAYGIPAQVRVFGPFTGSLANEGEQITLCDKNGVIVSTIDYKDGGRWPKAADGAGHSMVLRTENGEIDNPRNWRQSASPDGTPGTAETTAADETLSTVIDLGDTWKHFRPTSDPGTSWRGLGFDDSTWGSGPGLLGFTGNPGSLPAPGLQTALPPPEAGPPPVNAAVHLFRKTFNFDGNPAGATYSLDQVIDDGVVYYLNGQQLGGAIRMTATGNWDRTALQAIGNATVETSAQTGLSGIVTGLVNGENVLTAEVHNISGQGSDLIFGARLKIIHKGGVRLSEVHFAASGNVDWVEVENAGSSRPATGLFIASTNDFSDKVALSGTLPGAGFASFDVNFVTGADATIYLIDATNRVLGVAEVERVLGRPSLQAVYPPPVYAAPAWEYIKTAPDWYSSVTDTRNAATNVTPTSSIVINEIMCDPMQEENDGEFLELKNTSGVAVSLAGWKIRGGIEYDFGAVSIPAGGYLVVASNPAFIQSTYAGATVVGSWSGNLGNKGDLIRLIDANNNLADEVDYKVGGDWPDFSVNRGSSLELVNASMDNSRASAWRASDETNKAPFQTYTITGTYAQMDSQGGETDFKELHFMAPKDAHIALRNITLRLNGAGANLLTNVGTVSTTGSSANGWLCQGTHGFSFIDGSGVFHVIAESHGDNRPNRVEIDCTGLAAGGNYTLQFEARWVAGAPRIVAQTWDHSLGRALLLPVPANLGTAGAANSRASAAAVPQVDAVLHSPAVPKVSDAVRVTARIASAVPLTAVDVLHRADDINNGNSYVAAAMNDSGIAGDAVAGDGLWTATITSHQVTGRIVQFYVRATAQGGATVQSPPDGPNKPAMWLVDDRAIPNTLRRMRLIISAYDRDALQTGSGLSAKYNFRYPRLANRYFNATFIHNEQDVYYLAEIHKSGSPFTRSDANTLDRGKLRMAEDRVFRERQKTSWDNDGAPTAGNRHHNRMVRYLLYLCGFQGANQEEFVHFMLNSDTAAIRNDTEPTDTELVNRTFPNGSDGQLMQVEDQWWFTDAWGQTQRDANWTYKSTDEPIRYHTDYSLRTQDIEYDYSALTEMFRQLGLSATDEQLARIMDTEQIMMVAAVRGYCADWDSQTVDRGKNCYFYRRPSDGRWIYLHWDSDLAFRNAGTDNIIGTVAGGNFTNYVSRPPNRRMLNYYLTELVNKWATSTGRASAWLDAEENSSPAFTVEKSFYLNFFSTRQTKALAEINLGAGGGPANSYTAPYAITTPGGGNTTANTLTLNGTAPSTGYRVVVVGHPEAIFTWVNQTTWSVTGIVLKNGLNTFTVQLVDINGTVLATTTFNITKTNNAPPVMAMNISPASQNAALSATTILDAAPSYDPDGGGLTFGWSHTPAAGVTVTAPTAASRQAIFSIPGVYSFTATGTDSAPSSTPLTREITAYNVSDFSSFGVDSLEAFWSVQNAVVRAGFTGAQGAWYSLEETPNNLVLQTLNNAAKPLAYTSPTHPLLQRPLPASADFTLQTDLTLEGRRTGSFMTGLYLETVESGVTIRYAFGIDGGNSTTAKRLTSGSITNITAPQTSTGFSAIIRLRRVGTQLRFERRANDGVWNPVATQAIPAGATAVKGGLFLSTSVAENARVSFDYFLLADPTNTTSVGTSLRITEIMYHPADPGIVEFIELRNVGATTINLQGCTFEGGAPFDSYPFGDVSLAPGAFAIITNDSGAFQTRYGFVPTAQWPGGSLNNAGEAIILRDPEGNPIHDFDYDDVAPWPTTPDGLGPSLEVVDVNGNYDLGTNWRASFEIGGSPGYIGAGPDTDGDGQPDSWEALFGTNPNSTASRFFATSALNGSDQAQITFPTVAGRQYRIDYTDSFAPTNWQMLATVPGTGGNLTYTDPTVPRPSQRFYKVTALP